MIFGICCFVSGARGVLEPQVGAESVRPARTVQPAFIMSFGKRAPDDMNARFASRAVGTERSRAGWSGGGAVNRLAIARASGRALHLHL